MNPNESVEHLEAHVSVSSPDDSALDLLQKASGLSRQRIKLAMAQGAVWLTRGAKTRRLRRTQGKLHAKDELHLYYDAAVLAEMPAEATLVADLGGYSVWDKPYGMRSQGSKWGDHCTIGRWAERHLQPQRPSFTVHRLDRAANGLILVAHNRKIAAKLSKLFQKRVVEKRYLAVVNGDFSKQPNPCRVEEPLDGKSAISEFSHQELTTDGSRSLVEVLIETGRKHQVRRHLAHLGFPVAGDRLYGCGAEDEVDLQLTAYRLAFECPVSGELVKYELARAHHPAKAAC